MNSANLYGGGDGGVCVYVCVLAHACARVRGQCCDLLLTAESRLFNHAIDMCIICSSETVALQRFSINPA